MRTHYQCFLRVCKALYRESIEASGVDLPSSLRRAISVALIKVAYFRISLVLRITFVMRVHEIRVLRSSVWKVLRATTAFQRPALNLASDIVSVAKHYYSDDD
jgi:hypothetical protein